MTRLTRIGLGLIASFVLLGIAPVDGCAQQDSAAARRHPRPGGGQRGERQRPPAPPARPLADTLPSSLRPNEPAGYQWFAEFRGNRTPERARISEQEGIWRGGWYQERPGNPLLRVEDVDDAPVSGPDVVATVFPRGFASGRGPVLFGGWDRAGKFEGQKRALYLTLWIKFTGRDFEQSPAGTKLGFIGFGRNPARGGNEGVFLLEPRGAGGQPYTAESFHVRFHMQGHLGDVTLKQNRDPRARMTVGQWHQWEVVMVLNELGRSNGRFSWWIDGVQVLDYQDVAYVSPESRNGFFVWTWNPTWNGVNYRKSRPDKILIDHVYMSGLPLR